MIGLLISSSVAMVVALAITRVLITWLLRRQVSQPILAEEQVRAPQHQHKAGTPTMGGIAIVVAAFTGWAVAHLRRGVIFTDTGLIVMATIIAAGAVGFLDDWLKVRNRRNLGLTKRTKSLGLLVVGCGFAVLMLTQTGVSTTLAFTRSSVPGIELGDLGWAVLAVFMIQATSNAVNLTDGLDGLVAGSAILTFLAQTVIAFVGFRNFDLYQYPHALDLAVMAVAMAGACAGFLWYNAAPAQIFMGDVGALAIGTAMACFALATNTHLLLVVLGGLYVIETLSVMMQFTSYRYFGRRRIFRMAPIHHHFEQLGWPETTIIVRFWIAAGTMVAIGLGMFYADFLSTGRAG